MKNSMKSVTSILLLGLSSMAFATTPVKTPELIAKGKASYLLNCLPCHGPKGDGKGPAGLSMVPSPRNFKIDKFKAGDTEDAVFLTLTKGLPNTAMVGFGYLSEDDRWGLTYYLLSFRKPKK